MAKNVNEEFWWSEIGGIAWFVAVAGYHGFYSWVIRQSIVSCCSGWWFKLRKAYEGEELKCLELNIGSWMFESNKLTLEFLTCSLFTGANVFDFHLQISWFHTAQHHPLHIFGIIFQACFTNLLEQGGISRCAESYTLQWRWFDLTAVTPNQWQQRIV
jgi:hypothetical protein